MSHKRITKGRGNIHSIAGVSSSGNANALLAVDKQKTEDIQSSSQNVSYDGRSDLIKGLSCATAILKAGSNKSRLIILCRLARGASQIEEFEELLSTNRAIVSMHLSRLRMDGLVDARRIGRATYFLLKDERTNGFSGE
ncbi:MAG: helix-turn-helix transcriptional regulator [Hyphomicrobiales bacterium]|nr:helix-turn-helix transcriptional regulator [Hyphomicrobiales bacterium]MCP5000732.1 helix-turn-helix transcriptional regulator [Hyphomicrobiales bacterium]